jgi:hypothetical protein
LTATIRSQSEDVDVIDCLLPFVKVALNRQPAGSIFSIPSLASSLQTFGLQIPDLVLQQLSRRLQDDGLLEKKAGAIFVKHSNPSSPAYAGKQFVLDQAFDSIDKELAQYARDRFVGLEAPPASTSWDNALLHFLKNETSLQPSRGQGKKEKPVEIAGRLIGDKEGLERLIVRNFIQECDEDPARAQTLNNITQVFAGILIEDFIGNVQSLGARTSYSSLRVYYDTTVLLRLLGTSGERASVAAVEIHNALQSLGCLTHFLEITRSEVKRILSGIADDPLLAHPETAEPYQSGEFDRAFVRDLVDTFELRLERNFGITLFKRTNLKTQKSLQIDERELKQTILSRAENYREATAEKDAQVVGTILQFRRGETSEEVGTCKHLFISKNNLLQKVTKEFVDRNVEEYADSYGAVPPILTIGQISTLAWLYSSKKLPPAKITRELVTACYNAVMPTPEWVNEFNKVIKEYAKDHPQILERLAESAIFRKSARFLMQEASLNQAKLIPSTNISEIVDRAIAEGARRTRLLNAKHEEIKKELLDQLDEVKSRVAELEQAKVRRDEQDKIEEEEFERREREREQPKAPDDVIKSGSSSVRQEVVILVHGIRDYALWQNEIGNALKRHGFEVESTNYGRLNLMEFLAPTSYFRKKAIAKVENQIRIIKETYPEANISVIAHSFGTYVIARMMRDRFDIKFGRVIFCGSVVEYDFPFEQVRNRFLGRILNDVGTRDIWPAMADSVTIGYGSAGTFGFRRPLVQDRWHNNAGHGFFFENNFCEEYWVPFLRDGSITPAAASPERPRLWVRVLSVVKIKYVVLLAGAIVLAVFIHARF